MTEPGTPVVFVHGLWLHSSSWQPWLDLFTEHGYAPVAPPWPGEPPTVEEARSNPASMGGFGVGEITDAYAEVITGLPAKPIVIGHSFGGLIAQILLGRGLAAGAVAIDAAPIKGVLPLPLSSLKVASIALRSPATRKGTVGLTAEQFTYGFANTRTAEESAALYARTAMPSPGRPLFQAAAANFTPHAATTVDLRNSHRGPLLLTEGGQDHTVAPPITESTYKLHAKRSTAVTDIKRFVDRDHSLAINSDWREIADESLAWLKDHSL